MSRLLLRCGGDVVLLVLIVPWRGLLLLPSTKIRRRGDEGRITVLGFVSPLPASRGVRCGFRMVLLILVWVVVLVGPESSSGAVLLLCWANKAAGAAVPLLKVVPPVIAARSWFR